MRKNKTVNTEHKISYLILVKLRIASKLNENKTMSHNNENELAFLSAECISKLNKISVEMSKFIVLSTFRNMETKWCATDAKAKKAVTTLFSMKGRQICHLIKQLLSGGLVLTPDQRKAVLNYLYARTERIRSGMVLDNCSTTFFKILFDKYLGSDGEPNKNNKRPREESATRETNKPRKSIRVIAFMPTVGMMPMNGCNYCNTPYGKIPFNAQHGNIQFRRPHFGHTPYGNLIRSVASHTTMYLQPRSEAEVPRKIGIRSAGNIAPPQPPKKPAEPIALEVFKKEEKKETQLNFKKSTPTTTTEGAMKKERKVAPPQPAQPIAVKVCKKEEKKEAKVELKNEMPSTSTGGVEPAAMGKEKTEPGNGDSKKNLLKQIHELFGKDDDDSDVEIIGSYTVGIPAEHKFVRIDFDKN